MSSYSSRCRRNRTEVNKMSGDEFHYKNKGDSSEGDVGSKEIINQDIGNENLAEQLFSQNEDRTNTHNANDFLDYDSIGSISSGGSCESSDGEFFNESREESDDNKTFQSELAHWYIQNNISKLALSNLLEILRKYGNVLPKDARTLIKTPRTILPLMGNIY